jgi:hypothetical protein
MLSALLALLVVFRGWVSAFWGPLILSVSSFVALLVVTP